METGKIVVDLRVVSQAVKPFQYGKTIGEVLEVKAVGDWGGNDAEWPISLHITVPPGCGAIPVTGDSITVIVSQKRYPKSDGVALGSA